MMKARFGFVFFLAALLAPSLPFVASHAQDTTQKPVTRFRVAGGVPHPTYWQKKMARVQSATRLNLMTLVLEPRNWTDLQNLLEAQQNPASPQFHQWLTPEEFGARFGRTEAEYAQLTDWLTAQGLQVTNQWPNRLQLTFAGPAAAVEQAFAVEMNYYQVGSETAYAADRTPSLPQEIVPLVRGVSGLHAFSRFHPAAKLAPAAPGNLIGPADIATAYNLKGLLAAGVDGTGADIAIASRCDFNVSDVTAFRSRFNLPAKDPVKLFPFGPQPNRGGVEEVEVVLDCELSGGTAPDATVRVMIAPDIDFSIQAAVNTLPSTRVISVSFGGCERVNTKADADFFEFLYAQAAAQGQTVFVSSGDDGVSDCVRLDGSTAPGVNILCTQTNVVGVGGTNLDAKFDSSSNATGYGGETAWSGSGGGDSIYFTKPSYQVGLGVPDNPARNVPDVALLAGSPPFAITIRGNPSAVSGTSCSTPVWAGFCSLLNEGKQAKGLGNINPALYRLGDAQARGTGPKVFNDVTTGNNSRGSVQGFNAQPGYDRVTGWGSFNGEEFVKNFGFMPNADVAAPTVTVLAPQGGEKVTLGQPFTIRWMSSDNTAIVRHDVLLSDDSGVNFNYTLAVGLPATAREFIWNSPKTLNEYAELKDTTKARIAVRAIDAAFNSGTGVTTADFTLAGSDSQPPTVRVMAPNGGEKLKGGQSFTITWTSSDAAGVIKQDILLSSDEGKTFPTTIATGLVGSVQSFAYSVPPTLKTKTARIRVTATDSAGNVGQDDSDKNFIIKKKK
ncbi:MAG: hypothetical protein K1Y36_13790 [Blastocatellia bacterium]|nr:hypothetical protein [Blastocatellia bacterium]